MPIIDEERLMRMAESIGRGSNGSRTTIRVAVVGAVLAAIAIGYGLTAGAGAEVTVPVAPEDPASAASAEETAAPLLIHVVGAVTYPGVYELPAGSRVHEAIQAAGGAGAEAALAAVNLARPLMDGEQVYIPTVDEVGSPGSASAPQGSASSSPGRVNVNRATASELESLPGVGPATAARIIADREANGPFEKPEDLMRVSGIGPKRFEAMQELVVVR